MPPRSAVTAAAFAVFAFWAAAPALSGPVPYVSGPTARAPDEPAREEPPALALRHDITGLVRFSAVDGWLSVEMVIPATMRKPQRTWCRIDRSSAVWAVRATQDTPDGYSDEPVLALSYEDAGSPEHTGHTRATVYAGGDYLAFTSITRMDGKDISVVYRSHREYKSVQVEIYIQQEQEVREPLLNEHADSLRQLCNEHGEEVERYVAPVLKKVSRRNLVGPEPGDVYSVFSDLQPGAGVARQLRDLLPLMDDPAVDVRERASAQLARLGDAGVLAALRCDRRELSPEQKARLTLFIAENRRGRNVELARRDLLFLTQCLEHDDAAVRAAAKTAIEKLVGRAIAFDPNGEFDARPAQVEVLRRQLTGPTASAAE